jgi:hypothetical protein
MQVENSAADLMQHLVVSMVLVHLSLTLLLNVLMQK